MQQLKNQIRIFVGLIICSVPNFFASTDSLNPMAMPA